MPGVSQKDAKKSFNKRFHALDEDGMARVGESLGSGDVFINKYAPVINESQMGYMNQVDLT